MKLIHKISIVATIILMIALLIGYVDYQINIIKNQIQYMNNYSICIKGIDCNNLSEVINDFSN